MYVYLPVICRNCAGLVEWKCVVVLSECAARKTRLKATQTNGCVRLVTSRRKSAAYARCAWNMQSYGGKRRRPKPCRRRRVTDAVRFRPMFRFDVCESPNVYENSSRDLKQTVTTRQTISVSCKYVFRANTNSPICCPIVYTVKRSPEFLDFFFLPTVTLRVDTAFTDIFPVVRKQTWKMLQKPPLEINNAFLPIT